jgi:hypothetical protein
MCDASSKSKLLLNKFIFLQNLNNKTKIPKILREVISIITNDMQKIRRYNLFLRIKIIIYLNVNKMSIIPFEIIL